VFIETNILINEMCWNSFCCVLPRKKALAVRLCRVENWMFHLHCWLRSWRKFYLPCICTSISRVVAYTWFT